MLNINTLKHQSYVPMISEFRKEMGKRFATARKAKRLSQYELAERLGIKQPIIAAYEIGRTPVPVQRVPELAEELEISTDYLLGISEEDRKTRPGPESILEQRLLELKKLPRGKQKTVLEMLDGLLAASR